MKTKWCIYVIACLVSSVGATACADEVVETGTTFFVQTRGGQPAVCGLEYQIAFRDRTNRQGALAAIYGSLAWTSAPDNMMALILKVGGVDFDQQTQKPVAKFPVIRGFLAFDGKPVTPMLSDRCEDRVEFCGVYDPNTAVRTFVSLFPRIHRATPSGDLSIGFLRQNSGLDVVLPLNVNPDSFASDEFKSFAPCFETLSDRERTSQTK
ncbi:MAG: hypothetical protein C5B58_10265 [Acidobacteria bacterium]|nr:MAG: hypothetical protein C5B58_10265 [Acidobacteriota bacterium]